MDASTKIVQPHILDTLAQVMMTPASHDEVIEHFKLHPRTYDVLWKRTFVMIDDAPLFPRPLAVSVQRTHDPRYRCDCRLRQGDTVRYFCYTLSGTGALVDAHGEFRVSAGQAFLVETDNPLASYFYPPESRAPWQFLAFEFNGLQAHVLVRALLQAYGPIYDLPVESRIIQRLLGFEAPAHVPGQRHVAQVHLHHAVDLVTELLTTLLESKRPTELAANASDPVQQAISIITDSASPTLRVADVARRIGVSREHLSRLFQMRTGKSLRTFILEQKVHRACLMLRETDMPIKTIAEVLGYTEYTNFAHAFEQIMSVTPRQYRISGTFTGMTHLEER